MESMIGTELGRIVCTAAIGKLPVAKIGEALPLSAPAYFSRMSIGEHSGLTPIGSDCVSKIAFNERLDVIDWLVTDQAEAIQCWYWRVQPTDSSRQKHIAILKTSEGTYVLVLPEAKVAKVVTPDITIKGVNL